MSASATFSRMPRTINPSSSRCASRNRRAATRASASSSVESASHVTEDEIRLEVLTQRASASVASKPPIVFVHGSYHAAWCWSEHFFEYFTERGHDCHAISMRGQGGSDMPPDPDAKVSGSILTHGNDVSSFIKSLPTPPVLVGHSFGGLIAQAVLSVNKTELAGLALLASVPPEGNGPMVQRFLKRDFWASMRITVAFIFATFKANATTCRECFFSDDLPERELRKHMGQIAGSCNVRLLDLNAMNASLPIPKPPSGASVFVLGGEDDFVVDVQGVQETAQWGSTTPVILKNTAHDVMLDTRWEKVAEELGGWMERLGKQ